MGTVDVRRININNSPKKNGSCEIDSKPYLRELGVEITDWIQPIQFNDNSMQLIHRWSPYIQGFSASFVQKVFDKYRNEYSEPYVLDPFAGSGTVLVQSKLNGYKSFGNELNPWMTMIANLKLKAWEIDTENLIKAYESLEFNKKAVPPSFLNNEKQFNEDVLNNLLLIKGSINQLEESGKYDIKIINLLRLAFSSILIECSNLKRSPCLGYDKNKGVGSKTPFSKFKQKVYDIVEDINRVKMFYGNYSKIDGKVQLSDSKIYQYNKKFDLIITSPPYMNGMDYVINYKIEMSWLDFARDHKELKRIKDSMVVCDNVSKKLIRDFRNNKNKYTNEWIEKIKTNIKRNIERRGKYRRMDMADIVHKYFDDMYRVMKNVYKAMNKGARFILVVGDSLIVDEYVPTDLLIAKIGNELGLEIESIEKARDRRSGQVRSYKLRETIVTLKK